MPNDHSEIELSEMSEAKSEYLSFRVAENEYSVNIMSVREIRGWTQTTSLPKAPKFVRGVINLRGIVLPVVDLAIRLGLKSSEPQERNVIIVVDVDDKTLGLRVDAVSDILSISEDQMQSPPEIGGSDTSNFISGLTLIDDRMVRILDLSLVLPTTEEIAA